MWQRNYEHKTKLKHSTNKAKPFCERKKKHKKNYVEHTALWFVITL